MSSTLFVADLILSTCDVIQHDIQVSLLDHRMALSAACRQKRPGSLVPLSILQGMNRSALVFQTDLRFCAEAASVPLKSCCSGSPAGGKMCKRQLEAEILVMDCCFSLISNIPLFSCKKPWSALVEHSELWRHWSVLNNLNGQISWPAWL